MSNLGVEGHTSNHSSTMVGLLCRYILDFKKTHYNLSTCVGGGGEAHPPVTLSIYICMCPPRGDYNLTHKKHITVAEIIPFYQLLL